MAGAVHQVLVQPVERKVRIHPAGGFRHGGDILGREVRQRRSVEGGDALIAGAAVRAFMAEEGIDRHVERVEARRAAKLGAGLHRREARRAALRVHPLEEARFQRGVKGKALRRRREAGIAALDIARHIHRAVHRIEVAGERRRARENHQDKDKKAAHAKLCLACFARAFTGQITPAVCRRVSTGAIIRSIASADGFTSP